jgi:protein SMG6
MMHQLLGISTAPSVPASLRNIPEKYNIIVRLWTYGFHRLLENLRRSALHSVVALEHLQSLIYFAYTFYTSLYEEVNLSAFRAGWLEALGDLARYRMAVAAMLPDPAYPSSYLSASNASGSGGLTPHPLMTPTSTMGNASDNSDRPIARIDDSPSPSVGIVAARNFELEPEKERWRAMAREWYGAGVADTPGNGKLHHHLGLLSREADGEELRGIYHFTKRCGFAAVAM